MNFTLGRKLACLVGALTLVSIGIAFFALKEFEADAQRDAQLRDVWNLVVAAQSLATSIEHTAGIANVAFVSEDPATLKTNFETLGAAIEDLKATRRNFFDALSSKMDEAQKLYFRSRLSDFIEFQNDTAEMGLKFSPKAALVQATDPATIKSRTNILNAIGKLVAELTQKQNALEAEAMEAKTIARYTFTLVPAIAIAIGLAGAILFSTTQIRQPFKRLSDAMRAISHGRLETRIPFAGRRDEIGEMARHLEVFRDNAQALRRAQDERAAAEERLKAERLAMIRDLDHEIGQVVAAAAAGDFTRRVAKTFADPEIDSIGRSLNEMVDKVSRGIAEAGEVLAALGAGNFSARVEGQHAGAFAALKDGVNGMAADLERVLDELWKSEERHVVKSNELETTLNSISQGIYMVDAHGQLAVVNRQAIELLDMPEEMLVTRQSYTDMCAHILARQEFSTEAQKADPRVAEAVDSLLNPDRPVVFERERPNGLVLEVRSTPLPSGGFVRTFTDITEAKRREQEIRAALEDLKRFAYIASHDLQEPLRKIGTFSTLLADAVESGDKELIARSLGVIREASKRGRALVEDLLRFSKLRNQQAQRSPTLLGNMIDDALVAVSDPSKAPCFTLHRDIADAELHCDHALIVRVLVNLLENAIKFRKKDEDADITVATHWEAGRQTLKITVADRGIGFDPAFKQKLFQPFQRLVGKNDYQGSGIGLSLARIILDNHGWAIDASGEPDQGATFTLSVPGTDVLSMPGGDGSEHWSDAA